MHNKVIFSLRDVLAGRAEARLVWLCFALLLAFATHKHPGPLFGLFVVSAIFFFLGLGLSSAQLWIFRRADISLDVERLGTQRICRDFGIDCKAEVFAVDGTVGHSGDGVEYAVRLVCAKCGNDCGAVQDGGNDAN